MNAGMFTMEVLDSFFDREAIQRAAARARIRVLSKMGAFVRRRAQTSMRRRKGPSKPGEPPHAHRGWLRQFLFFAYDRAADTVVVGPLGFKRRFSVPSILEFGGIVPAYGYRKRDAYVAPRPYMGPALEAEEQNFQGLWHNSIVRGN